jgi:hypothetical protein
MPTSTRSNNPGIAVAVQSDGKILLAGGGPTANDMPVSRLNKDGSLLNCPPDSALALGTAFS